MECKTFYAIWLTDVDNTLLPITRNRNHDDFKIIGDFIRELEKRCILVVPVTFKTYSEIIYLSNRFGYIFPASIVEGGCAIISNNNNTLGVDNIELCRDVSYISHVLDEYSDKECIKEIIRISMLDPISASEILNLPIEETIHALNRKYTEIIYSKNTACINKIAKYIESKKLKPVMSKRFLHITSVYKENAVKILLNIISHRISGPIIASGDNIYDRGFIELADIPIIVSSDASKWFRRYPYICISQDIPKALLEHISRILLLKSI